MNVQQTLAERVFSDKELPQRYSSTSAFYDVRLDDDIVGSRLSYSQAVRLRDFYRAEFPGRYDILETKTLGHSGKEVFAGNASNFSHVPSHIPSHVTLYDVQIDGAIVARNLTANAARDFVFASVDILDIFSAIAEYLVSSDISFDYAMDVIGNLTLSDVFGVTLIAYNPATNNAPTPRPATKDWRKAKKVGREKVRKVRAMSYIGTPVEYREWTVLSISNLEVLYHGTKNSCLGYMNARMESGSKIYSMRVVKYGKHQEYIKNVKAAGYKLVAHKETICVGTKEEVMAYVIAGLTGKYLDKTAKAIRI